MAGRAKSRVDYPTYLTAAYKKMMAKRRKGAPTVISTFAGAGGSSMGYKMAGFKELLATDWDAHSCDCLRENFPSLDVIHGDIADLDVDELLKRTGLKPGELDVLDGSPPCQGFSTIGKRLIDDDRNALFRHFVRLLAGLQPKVFVMENVSGMVKGHMKLVFAEILKELKRQGYEVRAWVLNAKWFGVPQSRERIFFIGVRSDLGIDPTPPLNTVDRPYTMAEACGFDALTRPGHGWFEGEVREGREAPTITATPRAMGGVTLTETGNAAVDLASPSPTVKAEGIGGGFKRGTGIVRTAGEGAGSVISADQPSPTVSASSISDVWRGCAGVPVRQRNRDVEGNYQDTVINGPSSAVTAGGIGVGAAGQFGMFSPLGEGTDDPTSEDYNPALRIPGPRFSDTEIARLRQTKPGTSVTSWTTGPRRNNRHARARLSKESFTITKTPAHCHSTELRPLSIGEVMRLQSFPDQYQWPEKTTWSKAWARIGNSVPPLMMKAIADHIRKIALK